MTSARKQRRRRHPLRHGRCGGFDLAGSYITGILPPWKVDLSNYYTKGEIDNLLIGKVPSNHEKRRLGVESASQAALLSTVARNFPSNSARLETSSG